MTNYSQGYYILNCVHYCMWLQWFRKFWPTIGCHFEKWQPQLPGWEFAMVQYPVLFQRYMSTHLLNLLLVSQTEQLIWYLIPGPSVRDTDNCSRCTSALAAVNSSQLILPVEWFKIVGLNIPENVQTFVGIWHFVCQLVKTLVNKAVALRDVWQRWRHTIIPSECSTH